MLHLVGEEKWTMSNWKTGLDSLHSLWFYAIRSNRKEERRTREFSSDMSDRSDHWVVYGFLYSLEEYPCVREEDIRGMMKFHYSRQI